MLTYFSQVASIAVSEVIEELGLWPKIKWVNDILINQKKVCGILCESFPCRVFPDKMVILIGIGLNVNMSLEDCLKVDQPVTSLKIEAGKPWNKKNILNRLIFNLNRQLSVLMQEGFAPFVVPLKRRLIVKESVVQHDRQS